MALQLSSSPLRLELRNAFNLAHGSSQTRTNVLVSLKDGGEEGLGEIPIVPYYAMRPASAGSSALMSLESVTRELAAAEPLLGSDPFLIEDVLERLADPAAGISAATRCGVDLALHDLQAKRLGQPLYRILGLNPERLPLTSFTIAIDTPETMAERARQSGLPVLKIKLGGAGDDFAIVKAIREATGARLRLDANGGWSREKALDLIPRLLELDVELIEQPLSKDDPEGYAWLRSRVRAPIFADESFQSERDLVRLAPSLDGVVVKLMKSGGIRGALRQIHLARALDLKVMLSCMVESSLAVTAAANLGPLVDHVDLDGPLLIANDPFRGLRYDGARISLGQAPGLGASRL